MTTIAKIVYLIQGKLRPDFEGIELGVAEKIAMKSISKSSGIAMKKIEEAYRKSGDLGHAASTILEQKTQTTFLVEDITVERVYETLFKIAKFRRSSLTGHEDEIHIKSTKRCNPIRSKIYFENFAWEV